MKTNFIFCCAAIALLFSTFENLNAQWQTSGNNIYTMNSGNVGIGTSSPQATFDIFGNKGATNSQNFRITFPHGGNLTDTEFSALKHIPSLAGGNGWTALYAKQGAAKKAGVFDGDVVVYGKFNVAGIINAREIKVLANVGADFVFADDYSLRPLQEVEQFITKNKHLPDIAPADEMIQNGVNMGEFQIQLLQKVEELTLYVIELEKRLSEIEK